MHVKIPLLGYVGHWQFLLTLLLAALLWIVFPPFESTDFLAVFAGAIIVSLAVFSFFKRLLFRRVIAFDQGGVFTSGNWKFERVKRVPEVVEFIKELRANHTTALLSNQNPDMYDHLRRKFNLDSMFDYQVIPMHAWAEKPDPKIYATFLKITGRKASDVIFVDDSEENIIAAKRFGFKGIVFKSLPQLKEALEVQGVSV